MKNALEILNDKFNNKYHYLKLLNVTYHEETCECLITFLYPYQIDEVSADDKNEVEKFFQEFLSLEGQLKIKYKKSFLDDKLIINEVIEFFKNNKKGIFPYISVDNIKSSYKDQDVSISLTLNQDVLALIDETELSYDLKKHIEKLFIANVLIDIQQNEETLSDEIIAEEGFIPVANKTRRYEVKIEKKLIGGDIVPKPEFISDVKSSGASIILAGFLTNKNKKTFILKKGKHAGEEKSLYTFTLKDEEGSIDCVYFCPKTHEKTLEALDDLFMIICVGDVKYGLTGRLTYYIKKISIASPIKQELKEEIEEETYVHKKVVYPDLMPRKTQANLFEHVAKYNDFIMKNNIVVFDVETTGLDPEICEITEIGAVKIEHGEITERFSSFAKPKFSIPTAVQELTGITDEMVANAPRIEDVIYDFYEWSKDCIISGYNIVGFDLKFIKKVAKKIDVKFENDVIDAFIVAKQAPINPSNYKLGTVAKFLGIKLNDAHRAYNDAFATAQVLMELNKL